MEGKYIVEVKAYSKKFGMVMVRKCFKGIRKAAYEAAMKYAYGKALKLRDSGTDYSVTFTGEGWSRQSIIRP